MKESDAKPVARRRAVFLDRDGTLNEDTGHIFRVEDLKLLPRVGEGLKRLADMGFVLIVVTNQSGIAHGYFTEAQMNAFNAAIAAEVARAGVKIDRFYHSPYHPQGKVKELAIVHEDRKPEIGMLRRAEAEFGLDLSRCYMVGDRDTDMVAGQRAGCTTILLPGPPELPRTVEPNYVAANLWEAARLIEEHEASHLKK